MISKHRWAAAVALTAVIGLSACNPGGAAQRGTGQQPGSDVHQGPQRHAQDQRLQPL